MTMSVEPDEAIQTSRQFRLGYLFFATTMVAIGLVLCVRPIHPAAQGIGLSVVLFWISRGIFAVSKLMPKVAREIVFLIGLPLYIGSMLLLLVTVFLAVLEMVQFPARQ